MIFSFKVCLTIFSILFIQIKQKECQQNRPQIPISVLEEIMSNNITGGGGNDPLGLILGSLMPIMGSDNSVSGSPDNSTGVGVLDFFRNLVAMFLRAVLQVFKFFQLLARTMSGNDGKKLEFLSNDEKTDNYLNDNSISDKRHEKLERVLRQIQTSAEEFPLNFFISDEKALELENQIKDVFKQLPNFESKSMNEILKSDSFKDNFRSGLRSLNRNKREDFSQFNDKYNALNIPLNSLLNQFYKSHSNLNNEFDFEFEKFDE